MSSVECLATLQLKLVSVLAQLNYLCFALMHAVCFSINSAIVLAAPALLSVYRSSPYIMIVTLQYQISFNSVATHITFSGYDFIHSADSCQV